MPDTVAEVHPQPYGVRGWLLFLCISLSIINPILIAIKLPSDLSTGLEAETLYPWYGFLLLSSCTVHAFLIPLYLFAGVSLWRRRPGALKAAAVCLVSVAAYAVVPLVLPFLARLPSESRNYLFATALPYSARSVAYAGFWFWYLNVSRRV